MSSINNKRNSKQQRYRRKYLIKIIGTGSSAKLIQTRYNVITNCKNNVEPAQPWRKDTKGTDRNNPKLMFIRKKIRS